MGSFIIYEKPTLNKPYLIGGFEGWPDAGKISSRVVSYLKDKLEAKKFAELSPDDFYVFQFPGTEVVRPVTEIEDGLLKKLSQPSTELWAWKNKKGGHDLIILLGMEPHLRWNQFIDSVLDLAQELGVVKIYTIGGTYDRIPHTREPVISAAVNDQSLKVELAKYNIEPTSYEGPSSVHTLLLFQASRKNIKAVSLWGHAPHYIEAPNDKVCHRVLLKLTRILEIDLDLEDIKKAGEYLDEQVNNAIEQKAELKEYVRSLEDEYSKGRYESGELPAKEIIKEVENFLRKKRPTEE